MPSSYDTISTEPTKVGDGEKVAFVSRLRHAHHFLFKQRLVTVVGVQSEEVVLEVSVGEWIAVGQVACVLTVWEFHLPLQLVVSHLSVE